MGGKQCQRCGAARRADASRLRGWVTELGHGRRRWSGTAREEHGAMPWSFAREAAPRSRAMEQDVPSAGLLASVNPRRVGSLPPTPPVASVPVPRMPLSRDAAAKLLQGNHQKCVVGAHGHLTTHAWLVDTPTSSCFLKRCILSLMLLCSPGHLAETRFRHHPSLRSLQLALARCRLHSSRRPTGRHSVETIRTDGGSVVVLSGTVQLCCRILPFHNNTTCPFVVLHLLGISSLRPHHHDPDLLRHALSLTPPFSIGFTPQTVPSYSRIMTSAAQEKPLPAAHSLDALQRDTASPSHTVMYDTPDNTKSSNLELSEKRSDPNHEHDHITPQKKKQNSALGNYFVQLPPVPSVSTSACTDSGYSGYSASVIVSMSSSTSSPLLRPSHPVPRCP
nr:hypothetical protein CFP56_02860 [Quercus suber]